MEGSGDCQNRRFVAIATDAQLQPRGFATRLATIHNYEEGSLANAREPRTEFHKQYNHTVVIQSAVLSDRQPSSNAELVFMAHPI